MEDCARDSAPTEAVGKLMHYPADPPTVDEIVAVMRHTPDDRHGYGLRGMIVVSWHAGLPLQEALALAQHDLDPRRGALLVRRGKGDRRREVGMDAWGWEHLRNQRAPSFASVSSRSETRFRNGRPGLDRRQAWSC